MQHNLPSIDEIRDNFSFLDDWEERYKYIIELGKQLPDYPDEKRNEAHKVQGCVSQVWLDIEADKDGDRHIRFIGDSDAHIVRGLIAILMAQYSNRPVLDVSSLDPETAFDDIGLAGHISPQRSNGLNSMLHRIKEAANSYKG